MSIDGSPSVRPRVAILRGAALNPFEMQAYTPLQDEFDLVAVGSRPASYEVEMLDFPVLLQRQLVPRVAVGPYNRIRRRIAWLPDADYNVGLERAVGRPALIHAAETVLPVSEQAVRWAERSGAPLVLTCWENIPFRFEDDSALRRRKAIVTSEARGFIAVTPSARQALLEEGVAADRISVIPAAVDTERFRPGPGSADLRSRWRVPADAKLILFVGRLIQEKGVVELLRALRQALSDNATDAYLVVMGSGNQGERLRAASERLGISHRLRLVASTSYRDVPEAMRTADIVAAPSLPTPYWQEQFGMVLAEAMACGAAVLTTASGSIPEVVGPAAEVVPAYDIEALTSALGRLLTDEQLCEDYRRRGRERALEEYSVAAVSEKLRQFYRSALLP